MDNDDLNDICLEFEAEYIPEEPGTEVAPVTQTASRPVPAPKDAEQKKVEAEDDFQLGRTLLARAAKSLETALDNMDELGGQIETAGFWESYAAVVGKAGDLAKDLMEIHHKKDSLAAFVDDPESSPAAPINIENAVVYTGNLADMQRQLQRQSTGHESEESRDTPEE